MARLAIVWRNPNHIRHIRCWTHVRRDSRRSLYLILESPATGPGSWDGLPTLEIIRGRVLAANRETPARHSRYLPGA